VEIRCKGSIKPPSGVKFHDGVVHILRIHVYRPGETAERLLDALAERRGTTLMAHGSEVHGLRADGSDRDAILAEIERDLDHIARSLGVPSWTDHVQVS
jgi:hypothetical protein